MKNLLSVFLILTLVSCDRNPKIQLVPVTDEDIRAAVNDTSSIAKFSIDSRGAVWETWKRIHEQCLKNEFFKKPTYLGISNSVDIGSMYDKKGELLKWDFNKLFTAAERAKLINSGQPATCDYTERLQTNFQAILSTTLPTAGVEAELSTAVNASKDINVKVDNWAIDNLVSRELEHALNNTTDERQLQFKKDLLNKKHIILSQCVRILGFSATIVLEKEMSAALEAKLKEGIIRQVGNTNATIKYSYENSRTVKASTQGTFVVFVEFVKATKIGE